MNSLQILMRNRDEILKAEAGAFIHNIGKMSRAFLEYQRNQAGGTVNEYKNFAYQAIAGLFSQWASRSFDTLPNDKKSSLKDYLDKANAPVTTSFLNQPIKDFFKNCTLCLPAPFQERRYALGEFIEYQHYKRWYQTINNKQPGKEILKQEYSNLFATELLEAVHHVASGEEKTVYRSIEKQPKKPTYISSAFEYEKEIDETRLDSDRERLLENFKGYVEKLSLDCEAGKKAEERKKFYGLARDLMVNSAADTQRPIHDVTLWDISHSVASLYKSALAEFIMKGKIWVDTPHDKIGWRYLWVAVGGQAFWDKADRIPDIIGRRLSLHNALDQVVKLLEFDVPVGNEIYRDESGSLFTVPDIEDLLSMKTAEGKTLKENILTCFDQDDLHAEFGIHIDVGKELLGNARTYIYEALQRRNIEIPAKPERIETHWHEELRPENAELCSVCGVRPAGGPCLNKDWSLADWATSQKSKERGVCRFCLQRRGRRAKAWSCCDNLRRSETIWIDEAASANQRLVLLAGRFDLAGWIKSEHIASMGKPPTFARTRRCWETTLTFWKEIQEESLPLVLEFHRGWRLSIQPGQIDTRLLGNWHVYEAEINGLRIPLCWHPHEDEKDCKTQGQGFFRTCTNLKYLPVKNEHGKTIKDLKNKKKRIKALLNQEIRIYEPGTQHSIIPKPLPVISITDPEEYLPLIALIREPSLFMTIIPATAGLEAAEAINEKYQREMCKVKDKLPLVLGQIYFPKRTPIRAVMEAGRRITAQQGAQSRFDFECLDAANQRFDIRYDNSGRRQTKPRRDYELHVLQRQHEIWNAFSTLAVSQQHQIIQSIEWKRDAWFGRQGYHNSLSDHVFRQFVHDTVAGAQWTEHWNTLSEHDRESIVKAGISGELADIFELRKLITTT